MLEFVCCLYKAFISNLKRSFKYKKFKANTNLFMDFVSLKIIIKLAKIFIKKITCLEHLMALVCNGYNILLKKDNANLWFIYLFILVFSRNKFL